MRRASLAAVVVVAVLWVGACGSSSEVELDPTGGSVCSADGKVCIDFPPGSLTERLTIRVASSSQAPGGAFSAAYDIDAVGRDHLDLAKPARVGFALEGLPLDTLPSENLLRVYTLALPDAGGAWVALKNSLIDRTRERVVGETSHLSPFVVMRADRLSDGGLPIPGDGGTLPDGGPIIVPTPIDAGPPDAGRPDAGRPDAGRPDAGPPDAGPPDAGPPDAGPPDAGPPDAGPPDAGPPDAGPPDAGPPDAGPPDAGPPDAGDPDAGVDAGDPDAGAPDAGDGG